VQVYNLLAQDYACASLKTSGFLCCCTKKSPPQFLQRNPALSFPAESIVPCRVVYPGRKFPLADTSLGTRRILSEPGISTFGFTSLRIFGGISSAYSLIMRKQKNRVFPVFYIKKNAILCTIIAVLIE
jgi:hypothetical protein